MIYAGLVNRHNATANPLARSEERSVEYPVRFGSPVNLRGIAHQLEQPGDTRSRRRAQSGKKWVQLPYAASMSMGLAAHTRNAKREPWVFLERPDSRGRVWGLNAPVPDEGTMLSVPPSNDGTPSPRKEGSKSRVSRAANVVDGSGRTGGAGMTLTATVN